MKRFLGIVAAVFIFCGSVFAGGSADEAADDGSASIMKVGMVTDAGTIDDKSFNQGTWEGILAAVDEGIADAKYLKPAGTTEADYIKEIGNLYDAGYKFIVTPGFKFETAIYTAQEKYKDANFVLIDGYPHGGDWEESTGGNTVSIFFTEHEAGFLAAVAAALQIGDGEAGFIGGIKIPPVQKFNWGFQQGIAYANENMGTNITLQKENIVYQGSFDNVAAGQQVAASMYDKGVDVIFCAAGGVGVGVINEAKTRARDGSDVWIIGVDVDQYSQGIYEDNKSVIITSAVKYVGFAAHEMIKAKINGQFPGGMTITLDIKNSGVGIPESNPNLSADVEKKIADVIEAMKAGSITVSDKQGDLYS